jgi:hypothetical protein
MRILRGLLSNVTISLLASTLAAPSMAAEPNAPQPPPERAVPVSAFSCANLTPDLQAAMSDLSGGRLRENLRSALFGGPPKKAHAEPCVRTHRICVARPEASSVNESVWSGERTEDLPQGDGQHPSPLNIFFASRSFPRSDKTGSAYCLVIQSSGDHDGYSVGYGWEVSPAGWFKRLIFDGEDLEEFAPSRTPDTPRGIAAALSDFYQEVTSRAAHRPNIEPPAVERNAQSLACGTVASKVDAVLANTAGQNRKVRDEFLTCLSSHRICSEGQDPSNDSGALWSGEKTEDLPATVHSKVGMSFAHMAARSLPRSRKTNSDYCLVLTSAGGNKGQWNLYGWRVSPKGEISELGTESISLGEWNDGLRPARSLAAKLWNIYEDRF